jgi:integrase
MKKYYKYCEWCDSKKLRQNYKKHFKNCIYRIEIKLKKSEIERLKETQLPSLPDLNEVKQIEIEYAELKLFLQEFSRKSFQLNQRIAQEDTKNPIEKIHEMHVGESTTEHYLREWKFYQKYLSKQNKLVGKDSAESYIASLKCRPSSLRQKNNMIQALLQHLVDPSIKLSKIRKRISFIPKYAMTDEEIEKYLKEQSKINKEDYLMQKLMMTYGLRINTCALLRVKHLEFMEKDRKNTIHLPDSKVKLYRKEAIERDLVKLFKKFVPADAEPEDYVFLRNKSTLSPRKRTAMLTIKINKRIQNSKVIKKNPNYVYSSHMFRKTVAYNMYQKGVSRLKEKVRSAIGQSHGSSAVEYYIN